jgi:hypothetical protein
MSIINPIFLVGAERSGTTLLRLMLDHHPQIAFYHEFEFAVDQIDDFGNFPEIASYHEYLATNRIFLHSGFHIDHNLNYIELVNSFLTQKQKRDNKPLIGATVHYHFHHLLKIWPQAKFIHLIRDGRDVARSTIAMGWAGNFFTAVERWLEAEQLWQRFNFELSPQQKLTIQYEALIQNPGEVLTQICSFIGVPFDPAMYNYAERSTYELPNPAFATQWRRKLSNYQIRLIESRIGLLLKERGYPLSGLPHLTITTPLKWWLRIHDRLASILFRIRRYSLRIYLEDIVSRRLHLKKWQRHVQLKINACDNRFIK